MTRNSELGGREADLLRVRAVGWRAAELLRRSKGRASLIASLTRSRYLHCAGEMVWLGTTIEAMHPRCIVVDELPPRGAPRYRFALDLPAPWRPLARGDARTSTVIHRASQVLQDVRDHLTDVPPEFARVLTGARLQGPLAGARRTLRALGVALEGDLPAAARRPALALVGRGSGLTPAGDDLLGGALFARATILDGPRWGSLIETLVLELEARTHPISAVLTADLMHGEGPVSLHELARHLTARRFNRHAARRCAEQLGLIGGSSGWNVLTGVMLCLVRAEIF